MGREEGKKQYFLIAPKFNQSMRLHTLTPFFKKTELGSCRASYSQYTMRILSCQYITNYKVSAFVILIYTA